MKRIVAVILSFFLWSCGDARAENFGAVASGTEAAEITSAKGESPPAWRGPDFTNFGEFLYRGQEYLKLYVPASFEGRTAIERREVKGIEIFRGARFQRIDSKVQLRGLSTVFDFDSVKDSFDVQIHRSRAGRPGYNACMECHGGNLPRTTVIIGNEYQLLEPKPVVKGNVRFTIDEVQQKSAHCQITHWLDNRCMVRGDYRTGTLSGGGNTLACRAATLGLAGIYGHRLTWDGRLIFSKTESYRLKRILEGELAYRLARRTRITISGGAFLDGYVHFGSSMGELGAMTFNLERDDPQLLPSLFTRLKNDRFGYYRAAVQYEYPF